MIKLVDAVRSVLESTVKSGSERVENIHHLVLEYARGFIGEEGDLPEGERQQVDRDSIYQLVRDITAELGGFADDLLDVAEEVRDASRNTAAPPTGAGKDKQP